MIRGVLLTIVVLGLIAAAGWILCVSAEWDPHRSSLLTAMAVALAATLAALLPIRLARSADQLAVAQAGLISITLHLFIAIGACGFLLLTRALPHGQSFSYWMMAFYFATLILVATHSARAVRNARRLDTSKPDDTAPVEVNRD